MTFRQLQAFLLVVRTGTLSAAADHMGLTQSGVSRLVTELSRNVGFELFTRAGRGVQPTARGLAFFKVAEGVYDNAETLQRIAGEIRDGSEDRIRLACLPTIASAVLPAAIEIFHSKYPNVFIDIHAMQSGEAIEAFAAHKLDFAISYQMCEMEGLVSHKLGSYHYILAVHKDHVLAQKETVCARDLTGHSLMGFTNDSLFIPNNDEAKLVGDFSKAATKNIWCQSSIVRYALLANKRNVNIAEPFSYPLFAPHGVTMRPFTPNVESDLFFVLPTDKVDTPMYQDLQQSFSKATRDFASQHNLPIRVSH